MPEVKLVPLEDRNLPRRVEIVSLTYDENEISRRGERFRVHHVTKDGVEREEYRESLGIWSQTLKIIRPESPPLSDHQKAVVQQISKYIINSIGIDQIDRCKEVFDTPDLYELAELQVLGIITATVAKQVIAEVIETGEPYYSIIYRKDLWNIKDDNKLADFIKTLVANNADNARKLKNGDKKLLGWFTGPVMREFKGANGKDVQRLIQEACDATD